MKKKKYRFVTLFFKVIFHEEKYTFYNISKYLIASKNVIGSGNGNLSARRYEVTEGHKSSIAKFQSLSMSATTGRNNHVATQNNVMMNSVAVETPKSIEFNP